MVGRRLDLWRLRDFHVTRVDAPEDVLLYECVARENPADRRLVALAQVASARRRPRRGGHGHRRTPRRARGGELPRGDPAGAHVARCGREQARLQPRVGPGLARRRGRSRAADRAAGQDHPADRRCRHRGGGRAGHRARGRREPDAPGHQVPRPARRRCDRGAGGTADRAPQAPRRVRRQGRPRPAPRSGLPLRARGRPHRSRRRLRRVRPRRHRRAGARQPAAGPQQVRHPGRRRHHADRPAPGGCHPGRALRRPDEGARRRLGAGVLTHHRRDRPRGADAGAGGVVRAVRGRPDLDGLRHGEHGLGRGRRSSGSSSSPRPAARSTSSSRASTSERSRTGTPRRRCSCTPRASW